MWSFRRKHAPGGAQSSAATPDDASPVSGDRGQHRDQHGPVILIADDNETVREAAGQLVRRRGYEPLAVADGGAAVDMLKRHNVDALILDLHMPGGDGFEVLAYAQEHRQSLPVILVTGLPPEEIQDKMTRTGTDTLPPMFQKPCDYEQMLDVVELMMSGELQTG